MPLAADDDMQHIYDASRLWQGLPMECFVYKTNLVIGPAETHVPAPANPKCPLWLLYHHCWWLKVGQIQWQNMMNSHHKTLQALHGVTQRFSPMAIPLAGPNTVRQKLTSPRNRNVAYKP